MRRWSVVKLGLNICFFPLSRRRSLLGCWCESVHHLFLPLRSLLEVRRPWKNQFVAEFSIFSDFPATANLPANDMSLMVDATWRTVDRIPLLHSHNMVGLEWSYRPIVKNVHTSTKRWKLSCLEQIVLVAWHNHTMYNLRQLFANIRIHTRNIAMLNKQPNQQAILGAKPPPKGSAAHSLLLPISLFQRIAPWFTIITSF